jgi:hypothetical protein
MKSGGNMIFGNKKLCWEFLDTLSLSKGGYGSSGGRFVTRSNGPFKMIEAYWEYRDACSWCGEPYFAKAKSNNTFCSIECIKAYRQSLPKIKKPSKYKKPSERSEPSE